MFWVLYGLVCGVAVAGVGLFFGVHLWRGGDRTIGLGVTVVALGFGGLVAAAAVGRNLDDRVRVCTVTNLDVDDSGDVTHRNIQTRECGELEARSTAVFDQIEENRTYRLRIRGGRWLSKPNVYRVLPCYETRCLR